MENTKRKQDADARAAAMQLEAGLRRITHSKKFVEKLPDGDAYLKAVENVEKILNSVTRGIRKEGRCRVK